MNKHKDKHNKQEHERITKAWVFTLYWGERTHDLKSSLEKVMRKDASQRSTYTTTRALFMRLGLKMFEENPTVGEVQLEDNDIILGGILVYKCIRNCEDWGGKEELHSLLQLLKGADQAHRSYMDRRLSELQ